MGILRFAVMLRPYESMPHSIKATSSFKIIDGHETELNWIKSLQKHFPLGLNDKIYHEGNISKMLNFNIFSLSEY